MIVTAACRGGEPPTKWRQRRGNDEFRERQYKRPLSPPRLLSATIGGKHKGDTMAGPPYACFSFHILFARAKRIWLSEANIFIGGSKHPPYESIGSMQWIILQSAGVRPLGTQVLSDLNGERQTHSSTTSNTSGGYAYSSFVSSTMPNQPFLRGLAS